MKKTVHSSNLCLRFYKRDGWVRSDLFKYLLDGDTYVIHDSEYDHRNDPHDEAYFSYGVGVDVDLRALYDNEVGDVVRAFDDYPEETNLEFMRRMI